ncbi:MAG: thioredoxin [Thermoprotei archaeon]
MEDDRELEELLRKKALELARKAREVKNDPYPPGKVVHLDSRNFDDFITRKEVALVDFWAEWCAPCFILAPVIEELARDYPQVGFGKINSDENPEISARYGVMSLPTVLIFKDGEPVDAVIGAVPREVIESRLRVVLND